MSHPTHIQERNQDATIYIGDLDPQVNEAILWELFLQCGPVVNVHIPKDKLSGVHSGYGFVEFRNEEDSDYSIKIMNMIKLFGKPIRVNKASQDKKTLDVGANLFVGNLDPEIDEKMLYDIFSAFGFIIQTPKIMRDENGTSRGFGFVSFESFESSDAAINAMNSQYVSGRPISVGYALKKDSKTERHGSEAERLLAAKNPHVQQLRSARPAALAASRSFVPPQPFAPPMAGMHMMPPPGFPGGPPPGFPGGPPPGFPGGPPPGFPGGPPPGFPGGPGFPPPGFPMGMPPPHMPPPPPGFSMGPMGGHMPPPPPGLLPQPQQGHFM